jgi:hypothetical protein
MPELRRRPRVFPWLFALALGAWAFIVSTGRTEQVRAAFDAVVSNVTGLIGTGQRLTETAGSAPEAPSARKRAATGGARTEGTPSDSGSIPLSAAPPAIVAPSPDLPPMVVDSTRPVAPPNDTTR